MFLYTVVNKNCPTFSSTPEMIGKSYETELKRSTYNYWNYLRYLTSTISFFIPVWNLLNFKFNFSLFIDILIIFNICNTRIWYWLLWFKWFVYHTLFLCFRSVSRSRSKTPPKRRSSPPKRRKSRSRSPKRSSSRRSRSRSRELVYLFIEFVLKFLITIYCRFITNYQNSDTNFHGFRQ